MPKAKIAAREPIEKKLEAGKQYSWCACGLSSSQPFCDGSHSSTEIEPKEFSEDNDQSVALCLCKQTGTPPYCDGTHARLPDDVDELEMEAMHEGGDAEAGPPGPRNTAEEPHVEFIHRLATDGLEASGSHGPTVAMGVPRDQIPSWDGLQLLTAQLARQPLGEDVAIDTAVIVGPKSSLPLQLNIPLLVTDMSYGALSPEAKISLAKGAEQAGTAICSGEGGMLPEEQQESSRYLFELGTGEFGYRDEVLRKVQAFHFKAGQAAKTGVGGHLPAEKVDERIAKVRGVEPGVAAISPAAFADLHTPEDFAEFAEQVRDTTGGIPIGIKMSSQHLEEDLEFAMKAGVDYVILDGRGGGTAATPRLLRDHIGVPLLAALPRAKRWLDERGHEKVTLIATGGLRSPADFVKALALGADAIAVGNSAIQAIGCVAARICNTNNCPSGVATQDETLRGRLNPETAGPRLARFLHASTDLLAMYARACGHRQLSDFSVRDLTTCDRTLAELSGVRFAGH